MDLNDAGNRTIVGIVVVLLIIGAWYLGTSSKLPTSLTGEATTTSNTLSGSSSDTTDTTTGGAVATVQTGGEELSVKDQPAGSYVMVASATLAQTGWVAIRDGSGRTLGAARFDAGTYEAVQVSLLRNTESGQKYQALLYADDGDKAFDLHKDTLVMNADGSVAGASFSALNGD